MSKLSTCGTCGYSWPTSTHGGHSCQVTMQKKINVLESALENALTIQAGDLLVIQTTPDYIKPLMDRLNELSKKPTQRFKNRVMLFTDDVTVSTLRSTAIDRLIRLSDDLTCELEELRGSKPDA